MRALVVAAFVALAGCSVDDPSRWPTQEEILRACNAPESPARECAYPAAASPCAKLAVDARAANDSYVITATLRNACSTAFWHQGRNVGEMEREGMLASVELDGTRYYLSGGGAAWSVLIVAPMIPPGRVVAPGEKLEATWAWNGSLATPEGHARAPPGEHRIEAWLVRAADVRAQTQIRV